MNLYEIITEARIVVDLGATDKLGVMKELIGVLVASAAIPADAEQSVLDAVVAREDAHSTGVGQGVALPHGAVDAVDDLVGALGVSRAGIDFGAFDDKPAHLILLTVVPRNKLQAHVKTLPGIARLLNKSEFRERVRAADSAAAVMSVLAEEEGEDLFDSDFID